jgi:P22_AR N-terminal domain
VTTQNLTTINFHGAELMAIRGETPETTMVAMKPIAEGMGLDWEGQRQKIMRHPVLAPAACKMKAVAADVAPNPSKSARRPAPQASDPSHASDY